jgi:hypothetical protein
MKRVMTAVLALAVLGCAGSAATRPAPDWVSTPPKPDANFYYFTGAGTSKDNDQAMAEQIARGAMIDEIMRYIGVKVTAETTAVARASVDSFKSDVLQSITQTGSGRIAGLQVSDKYVDAKTNGTTVYLLARYAKKDLDKEKKRIEDLFIEQQRAVSDPETQAKGLEGEGDYYGAAVKYIQAATAAATSGLDNAKIKFERNINAAKNALDRIALVKLNDNLKTAAGTAFADPFTLKVVAGATSKDPGIPEVAITAVYTEIKQDRKQVRTVSLKTDARGMASFTYPVPEFVGPEKVTMMIDLGAYLDPLDNLPKEFATAVGGLEDVAAGKRVVFNLSTFSSAREIETGIAVVIIDESGSPSAGKEFAAGIMKALSDARFQLKTVAMDPAALAGEDDAAIIAAAAAKTAGGKTARVIFGTARFESSESDSGNVFAKVSGTVKVADLKTGAILLTVAKTKAALGKTEAAARAAAFQQLGQDIGQDIANKLR